MFLHHLIDKARGIRVIGEITTQRRAAVRRAQQKPPFTGVPCGVAVGLGFGVLLQAASKVISGKSATGDASDIHITMQEISGSYVNALFGANKLDYVANYRVR